MGHACRSVPRQGLGKAAAGPVHGSSLRDGYDAVSLGPAGRDGVVPAGPGAVRWLEEAVLGESPQETCPPLTGAVTADVAIVGGGFTGLWTVLHLRLARPALLERVAAGEVSRRTGSGSLGAGARPVFGRGGLGPLGRRRRPRPAHVPDPSATTSLARDLDRWFPQLGGVTITHAREGSVTHARQGSVDHPPSLLPIVGQTPRVGGRIPPDAVLGVRGRPRWAALLLRRCQAGGYPTGATRGARGRQTRGRMQ